MGNNNGPVVDNLDYDRILWDSLRFIAKSPASAIPDVLQLRPSKHRTDMDSKTSLEEQYPHIQYGYEYMGGNWVPYGHATYRHTIVKNLQDKVVEKDPNGIDLKAGGAKADLGKSPVFQGAMAYFPRALLEVAKVSQVGANKYSWRGWETVPDGINRYGNALARHLLAEGIEGPIDKDTKCLHAAQVAWNALARLELILKGEK